MVGLYLDEEKENYTGQEISNEDDESSLLKSFEEEEDPEECVECEQKELMEEFQKEIDQDSDNQITDYLNKIKKFFN